MKIDGNEFNLIVWSLKIYISLTDAGIFLYLESNWSSLSQLLTVKKWTRCVEPQIFYEVKCRGTSNSTSKLILTKIAGFCGPKRLVWTTSGNDLCCTHVSASWNTTAKVWLSSAVISPSNWINSTPLFSFCWPVSVCPLSSSFVSGFYRATDVY